MNGELNLNVKKVIIPDVALPKGGVLSLEMGDSTCLHICGDNNDWGYLLVDAFAQLFKLYDEIVDAVLDGGGGHWNVSAIGFGASEFRALDIFNRIRYGKPFTDFWGIPVVKLNRETGIRLFGDEATATIKIKSPYKKEGNLPF